MDSIISLHVRQRRSDRILRVQAATRALTIQFASPPIARTKVEQAKRELAAGKGVREAARISGISAASASRLKAAMNMVPATH